VVAERVLAQGLVGDLVEVWCSQGGEGAFTLDSYVPEKYQKQVKDAFIARGYVPVTLDWEMRKSMSAPSEAARKANRYENFGRSGGKAVASTLIALCHDDTCSGTALVFGSCRLMWHKFIPGHSPSPRPLRRVILNAQGLADVAYEDGAGTWLVTGPEPRLELLPESRHYLSGWVLLRGELHRRGMDFTTALLAEVAGPLHNLGRVPHSGITQGHHS
jgi:hypothetical protein